MTQIIASLWNQFHQQYKEK